MFRDFKRIWTEQAFTSRVVDEFLSMLETSSEMFDTALNVLGDHSRPKGSSKNIYSRDTTIDHTEREIRKEILVHLAANPGGNLPASLVLFSITRDAERIGDLVKELYELHPLLKNSKDIKPHYEMLLSHIGSEILKLMKLLIEAFRESDTVKARSVEHEALSMAKKCESIIGEIVRSEYTAAQTVVVALGTRYLLRIAHHISNIASSIYMPLPEIGSHDE